jgi:phage terminase large subunit GpA-like protein
MPNKLAGSSTSTKVRRKEFEVARKIRDRILGFPAKIAQFMPRRGDEGHDRGMRSAESASCKRTLSASPSTRRMDELNLAPPAPPSVCGWRLGFELPPRLTVSQWADAQRYIAPGQPEAGRWRTDRAPYAREPMDAFNDPDTEIVVLKWSSQVGKTEVLINVSGFFIAQDPSTQLFVMPNLGDADSFSRNRFGPTINATPALIEKVGAHMSRSASTTILEKNYPGGDIVFAGANSPASLASRPRRVVLFDEIDKYDSNIGNDGDPIQQGFQRTQNYWNARKGLASTPTLEGLSAIDKWFQRSDQRFYEVPCSSCGVFQSLEWEQVVWDRGKPSTARYLCPHCEHRHDQASVYRMVNHGHWRARQPFSGIAGFHVWAIYSPWVTMAKLVTEWEAAEGKPGEEQTFVNLKLGRCYNPNKGAETTVDELVARREDYGPAADGSYLVPPGVLLVTVSVDCQKDRFEVQYLGWGSDDEKWVLDYVVHWDDPTDPRAFQRLDMTCLRRMFQHPLGGELSIEAVHIDAGNWQQMVMEFVREQRAAYRQFYAGKGVGGPGRPIIRESEQKFGRGARLHIIGVDDGKTVTYQELATRPDPETGVRSYRVHFPRHLERSYFEMLLGEVVKVKFINGRAVREWVPKPGVRNEALDTFVGAMAARYAMSIDYEGRRQALSGTRQHVTGATIADLFKKN